VLCLALGLTTLLAPSGAVAATEVGATFQPNSTCASTGYTYVQSTSPGGQYAMPFSGVITAWTVRAGATPTTEKLKVVRPLGGNMFTTVGQTGLQSPAPNAVATYDARIPVLAGDTIGHFIAAVGECSRNPAPGFVESYFAGDPAPGSTDVYTPSAGYQIDLSVTLEVDADGDGFGDESQDGCLDNSAVHTDCVPPDTQITLGPKSKTKKKQATFEFSSNEPGASFECSVDGDGFKACVSPFIEKVGKGKHSFQVRATDAAGNLDGSPATFAWKVKKKKKK
jgi:hypothetical protein